MNDNLNLTDDQDREEKIHGFRMKLLQEKHRSIEALLNTYVLM